MAYICKIPSHNGTFDLEKCLDQGLPVDVMKKLGNNENVTLSNGEILKSIDYKYNIDGEHNFLGKIIPFIFIFYNQIFDF